MSKTISGFSDVIDNLTSNATGKALSARQGQILSDKLKPFKSAIEGLDIAYATPNTLTLTKGSALDDTLTELIEIPSDLTKDVITTFNSGGANVSSGGTSFQSGPGDTIHVWAIKNPTSTATDFCVSNALNPDLPTGFTLKRRVGSIMFKTASTIIPFHKLGDKIRYDDWYEVYNGVPVGGSTASSNYPLLTPSGVSVLAHVVVRVYSLGGPLALFESGFASPKTPPLSGTNLYNIGDGGVTGPWGEAEVLTNTNAEIKVTTASASSLYISVLGFRDYL